MQSVAVASRWLLIGLGALLLVLSVANTAHPSPELLWHGPDRHSSLPHQAPGTAPMTTATQPTVGASAFLELEAITRVEHAGFRVLDRLEVSRLDHPPR